MRWEWLVLGGGGMDRVERRRLIEQLRREGVEFPGGIRPATAAVIEMGAASEPSHLLQAADGRPFVVVDLCDEPRSFRGLDALPGPGAAVTAMPAAAVAYRFV